MVTDGATDKIGAITKLCGSGVRAMLHDMRSDAGWHIHVRV